MATISHALPIGALLSSKTQTYRVVSVLGAGGFGITYLVEAQTVQDGRVHSFFYAMKEHFLNRCCEREASTSKVVFSKPVATEVQNSLKDFVAEAIRLQKVGSRHDSIVKVKEIFQQNNTAYYVMEFLQGDSLRKYVQSRGRLTPEETRQLLEPIIDAVGFLHSNKMTHLDIKPDNIMLTPDPRGGQRPVLIDFGLSKHYDDSGNPTSTINTLGCSDGYSPIEQYGGITSFSPTSDIYSLGATMAFCLTGQNPTKATDMEDDERTAFSRGAGNVGVAVSRMLQANRGSRPQNIAEVYDILNAPEFPSAPYPDPEATRPLRNPEPPMPPTPPTPPVPPVPPTRPPYTGRPIKGPGQSGSGKKWLLIGGCAVGALALIGGAVALFSGGGGGESSDYAYHEYTNETIHGYYGSGATRGGNLPYPDALDTSAPVAVTMQWTQEQDMDLYVVQPDGQLIHWLETSIPATGASFSGDATSTAERKVETAIFQNPMPGTYDVFASSLFALSEPVTVYTGIKNGDDRTVYTARIDTLNYPGIEFRAYFKICSFEVGDDYYTLRATSPSTSLSDLPSSNYSRGDRVEEFYAPEVTRLPANDAVINRARTLLQNKPFGIAYFWDSEDDQDLSVVTPEGTDIYFANHDDSTTGGHFADDDLGGTGSQEYITFSRPTNGRYDAFVYGRNIPREGVPAKFVIKDGSNYTGYSTTLAGPADGVYYKLRFYDYNGSAASASQPTPQPAPGEGSGSSIPVTRSSQTKSTNSIGDAVSEYVRANTTEAYDASAVRIANNASGSGPLKVTLIWEFSNDCDLIVNQANGDDIYFGNTSTSSYGGRFHGDDTGGSGTNTESISWSNPGTGLYDVYVRVRGRSNGVVRVVVKEGSTSKVYSTRVVNSSSDNLDVRMCQFRYAGGGSSSGGSSGGSGSIPTTSASASTSSNSFGSTVTNYIRANVSEAYDAAAVRQANNAAGSGPLKVTLIWNFANDCDLIINQADQTDIYFGNTTDSSSGARFHGDDTGGAGTNVESVSWSNPPNGVYDAYVRVRGGSVNGGLVQVVVTKNGSSTVYSTRINKSGNDNKDFRLAQFNY